MGHECSRNKQNDSLLLLHGWPGDKESRSTFQDQ